MNTVYQRATFKPHTERKIVTPGTNSGRKTASLTFYQVYAIATAVRLFNKHQDRLELETLDFTDKNDYGLSKEHLQDVEEILNSFIEFRSSATPERACYTLATIEP